MPAFGSTQSERATMARALAVLLGAVALVAVAWSVVAGDAGPVGVLVPAGCALGMALLLARLAPTFTPTAVGGTLATASLLIGACVAAGGHDAAVLAAMDVWVAVFAAMFMTPRWAAAQLVLAAALLAGGLAVSGDVGRPVATWAVAFVVMLVAGGLSERISQAVRARSADLAAVSKMAAGLSSDTGEVAAATCEGLQAALRADAVIYLEPLPDGDGLQVIAMAGPPAAGMAFASEGVRHALERCFRRGEAQTLTAERPVRLAGDVVGLAQPVLRDGGSAAVVAAGWTTPRRRVSERARGLALLFAAEASVAMDRAERQRLDRERQALEINDNIVQGLVVAKYMAQRGEVDAAVGTIDETLERARRLISEQLRWVGEKAGGIRAGDLAREREASVSAHAPRAAPDEPSRG